MKPSGALVFTDWARFEWFEEIRKAAKSIENGPDFPTDEEMMKKSSHGLDWHSEAFIKAKLEERKYTAIDIQVKNFDYSMKSATFGGLFGGPMLKPMLGNALSPEDLEKFHPLIQQNLLKNLEVVDKVDFSTTVLLTIARVSA